MDDMQFTDEELELLQDMELRDNQLKNINKVMNGSITPKKLKRMQKEVYPDYLVRATNARNKADSMMKKKGFNRRPNG
jgi:hypothetical protein